MTRTLTAGAKKIEVPIIYTDNLSLPWAGGEFNGKEIRIRPKYKGFLGLEKHELKHAEQYHRMGGESGDFFERYNSDKAFKYAMELEAYGETIKYNGYKTAYRIGWIVDAIYDNYNIDKSKEEILNDLKKFLPEPEKAKPKKKKKSSPLPTITGVCLGVGVALVYFKII